jgi:hypothetical protein
MKTLRSLLLVLLALLLPLRGALAQAAHDCVGISGQWVGAEAAGHDHVHQAGHEQTGEGHDHGQHLHDHAPDAADACDICAASCTATSFMNALPKLAVPLPLSVVQFPALEAPPPSHPSEGQERPPRSI